MASSIVVVPALVAKLPAAARAATVAMPTSMAAATATASLVLAVAALLPAAAMAVAAAAVATPTATAAATLVDMAISVGMRWVAVACFKMAPLVSPKLWAWAWGARSAMSRRLHANSWDYAEIFRLATRSKSL
eukprot:scaffold13317_cov128-Isochrysis_galbana.AAC.2